MGLLQSPEPARKLAQQYGIRGIFTPEIVPSLQPVVILDNLATSGVENVPQRICMAQAVVVGVAAERSNFRFETPPRVIAQILGIQFKCQSDIALHVGFGATFTALTGTATGVITDGRLRSDGQVPAAVLTFESTSDVITNVVYSLAGGNTAPESPINHVDWIIGRTDGNSFDFMELQASAADQDTTVGIWWREFTGQEVK